MGALESAKAFAREYWLAGLALAIVAVLYLLSAVDVVPALTSVFTAYGLYGLAAVCFVSVSLLPWPSEPFIIIATKMYDPLVVFAVVMAASIASSLVNYWVGLKGFRFFFVKRDPEGEDKAYGWFEKWGSFALLFGPWVPFIGDLFPMVAGTLNMRFAKFFLFLVLARAVKTAAVVWFGVALGSLISL